MRNLQLWPFKKAKHAHSAESVEKFRSFGLACSLVGALHFLFEQFQSRYWPCLVLSSEKHGLDFLRVDRELHFSTPFSFHARIGSSEEPCHTERPQ